MSQRLDESVVNAFRFDGEQRYTHGQVPARIAPVYKDKKDYRKRLSALRKRIDARQRLMFAHDRYSLLVVFQALDAAGKDGTIRSVFSGVNPHGVEVSAFKRPSEMELDHNFLWRTTVAMPRKGNIGVFNRSYYEEVLVCRVHPEILTHDQKLPDEILSDADGLFRYRYGAINAFERYVTDNGTRVLKFFLNLSRHEQRTRLIERIDVPEKNWKFSTADLDERTYWNDYQRAYEDAINQTAAPHAPWYVIPADDKRTMRLLVGQIVLETLENMDMSYPKLSPEARSELLHHRSRLVAD